MDIRAESSISFETVFGNPSGDIPLAQIEDFLDKVVQDHFQNSKSDTYELIRVVDQGKVFWMTAEQTEQYILSMDDEHRKTLKKKLNDTLRGDSVILSQEIKILLMLAFGTLKQYRKATLIPYQEIQRVELVLNRVGRAAYTTLDQLRQVELHIKDTRRKNPVVDEFERKMAQFLTWQKQGENDKAALLAKDLVNLKKRYLIVSKVLTNDKNLSQTYRLEAQRNKKAILSNQKYLSAQREGVLQDELNDLRITMKNVKTIIEKESGEERLKYEQMLKDNEEKQSKSAYELNLVQREKVLLEKKEKETDEMIQKMEEELTVSPHTAETQTQEKPKDHAPIEHEEPVEDDAPLKSINRMVRSRGR